jgi:CheY-like chemotaxis protein
MSVISQVSIEPFENAEVALSFLNQTDQQWPTHIFIDVNMPGMNGFEFVDEYLKIPGALDRNSKLFILTSSYFIKDIESAKSIKCITKYITKPITTEQIEKIFRRTE